MGYDPDIYHRRSIRFKGYDYSSVGAYYITLCTQGGLHLFGEVVDSQMILNDAGNMVRKWYGELERKFPTVQCDVFVCMPNHVHFVIINHGKPKTNKVGADLCVCPENAENVTVNNNATMGEHTGSPLREPESTGYAGSSLPVPKPGENRGAYLPAVVQWYKTMTTNEYFRGVIQKTRPECVKKIWQRNYYEHIVRNDYDLDQIRDYILLNPAHWPEDKYYA